MVFRRTLATLTLAALVALAAAPARAQDVISKDDAALVKASFLNDLETLRTKFVDVSPWVYEHLFVMDNWHMLWYAAVAVVVFNARSLLAEPLAPMTVTIGAAVAFVGVVFFFSTASGGVKDESLTNRLVMHMVPALLFYLALILRSTQHQAKAAPLYT